MAEINAAASNISAKTAALPGYCSRNAIIKHVQQQLNKFIFHNPHLLLEAGQTADASRSMYIDDKAEQKLFDYIDDVKSKGEDGWTLDNPCSGFAREGWYRATGEDLNANWGPFSTPTNLKKSIIKANTGASHVTGLKPNGTSSASFGSFGRSSGSISLRSSGSSLLPNGSLKKSSTGSRGYSGSSSSRIRRRRSSGSS